MVTIVSSITIQKPIAEIFDYVTTIANWGIMHPAMAKELVNPPDHPTRAGETFVELFIRGRLKSEILWTVKECIPPTHWKAEAVAAKRSKIFDLGVMIFTYQLAEMNGETRVELTYSYSPQTLLTKLVNWLYLEKESRENVVAKSLIHLKHAMENGKSTHH